MLTIRMCARATDRATTATNDAVAVVPEEVVCGREGQEQEGR